MPQGLPIGFLLTPFWTRMWTDMSPMPAFAMKFFSASCLLNLTSTRLPLRFLLSWTSEVDLESQTSTVQCKLIPWSRRASKSCLRESTSAWTRSASLKSNTTPSSTVEGRGLTIDYRLVTRLLAAQRRLHPCAIQVLIL